MTRPSTSGIAVRDFREEDRDVLLGFTRDTWSWGDYVPEVLDEWVQARRGAVRVAETPDGRPVGLQHYQPVDHSQAWLSGLRVDPDFREQGVARLLLRDGMEASARDGARTLRYASEVSNEAIQHLSQAQGFKPRGTWLSFEKVFDAEACRLGQKKPPLQASTFPVSPGDRARVRSLLQTTGYRLYAREWMWLDLDRQALDELIQAGHAFISRSGFGGWGMAVIGADRPDLLEVTFLGPDVACALALLDVVQRRACEGEPGISLLIHVPQHDGAATLLSSLTRRGDWRPKMDYPLRVWELELPATPR